MTDAEIYQWFQDRLVAGVSGLEVIPPNKDSAPVKPYVILDLVPVDRFRRGLSSTREIARGFAQITVVSETNEDVTVSMDLLRSVVNLFPKALRYEDQLVIVQAPVTEKGYRDGPDWRTTAVVNYEAYV